MPIYTIEILMKNGEDLREIYENYYPGLCTKCEHNKGSDIEYFDENYEIYLPYQCDEQCIICDVENIRNVRFKKLYSIWKGEEISTTEMGNRLIFVD